MRALRCSLALALCFGSTLLCAASPDASEAELKQLEQLVERPEAPRKDHQPLGEVREPVLAHEEVVELERQLGADVLVHALLERQGDAQTVFKDRLAKILEDLQAIPEFRSVRWIVDVDPN